MDAGDAFFTADVLAASERPEAIVKARTTARGMKAMAYDVMCPGDFDLAAGLAELEGLLKLAGVTPVLANVTLEGKPPFERAAVREVAGIRVGLFGLWSSDLRVKTERGTLSVSDPIPAAKAIVEELAPRADLVIVVSHLGFLLDQKLAQEVPGIYAIIGAHSREWMGKAFKVGACGIYQAGGRCQSLGRLSLAFASSPPGVRRPPPRPVFEDLVALGSDVADDPQVQRLVADGLKEIAALTKARQPAPAPAPTRAAAPPPPESYWGALVCAQCHAKQHEFWTKTPHARALETLVKKGKQSEESCLACHVTGYTALARQQRTEGRTTIDLTGYEGVQCESCHGPGSNHSQPQVRTHARALQTCLPCHTKKESPRFDFAEALPRLTCPRGP